MSFCPRCGAPIKAESAPPEQRPAPVTYRRDEKTEKHEKHEKQEKGEKTEKHEKGEYAYIGPLIGGIVLLIIGLVSYLQVTGILSAQTREMLWASFLIIVGVVIALLALYAMMTARRRHPAP
jgi:cation transport ATPase